MPIYDIFDSKEADAHHEGIGSPGAHAEAASPPPINPTTAARDRFFSSLAARLFFVLLFLDLLWALYAVAFFSITSALSLVTALQVPALKNSVAKYWVSVKRSFVCGLSLFIALFQPRIRHHDRLYLFPHVRQGGHRRGRARFPARAIPRIFPRARVNKVLLREAFESAKLLFRFVILAF